jgi:hypothetical protein
LHTELAARVGEAGVDDGHRRLLPLSLACSEQRHLPSRAASTTQWLSSECAFGGLIGVMSELLADGVASSIDITALHATRKSLA